MKAHESIISYTHELLDRKFAQQTTWVGHLTEVNEVLSPSRQQCMSLPSKANTFTTYCSHCCLLSYMTSALLVDTYTFNSILLLTPLHYTLPDLDITTDTTYIIGHQPVDRHLPSLTFTHRAVHRPSRGLWRPFMATPSARRVVQTPEDFRPLLDHGPDYGGRGALLGRVRRSAFPPRRATRGWLRAPCSTRGAALPPPRATRGWT